MQKPINKTEGGKFSIPTKGKNSIPLDREGKEHRRGYRKPCEEGAESTCAAVSGCGASDRK